MKEKTRKRIKKRFNNLPRYFVDSSVFVEIIFKQDKAQKCKNYLNQGGYKYRLETSSVVIGEIIKSIYNINDVCTRDEATLWLNDTISKRKIEIQTPSRSGFTLALEIMDSDTHLGPMDALIFGDCVDTGCKDFLTKDSDFSLIFGKKYGVRIHAV